MDDVNSTEPINVAQRVEEFVAAAQRMAEHIDGSDIMFTMGGAFSIRPAANELTPKVACLVQQCRVQGPI